MLRISLISLDVFKIVVISALKFHIFTELTLNYERPSFQIEAQSSERRGEVGPLQVQAGDPGGETAVQCGGPQQAGPPVPPPV